MSLKILVHEWAERVESGEQTELTEVIDMTTRTNQQNASMWLACELLASEFTDRGLDMVVVLEKAKLPIMWDKKSVQSAIYNAISKAMYNETSSGLETADPSKVWKVIQDFTESNWQFSVPWPSEESLSEAQR